MDTRKKIVDRTAVPAGERLYVSGWFDPLTAAHALRLAELRTHYEGLVVVITDPQDPILPSRARAELAASLASVDYVVIGGSATLHLEEEHAKLRNDLIAHTVGRNRV